jgi:hypothetical protein
MYDSLTYSSYESDSASQLQFLMTKEDSEIVSKVVSNVLGNILNCLRPSLLQKLRDTCPGSCVAC